MRKILTSEEAEEVLKPFYPQLIETVEKGIMDYNSCLSISNSSLSIKQVYEPATKSMIIWNYIINHAKNTFSNNEYIKPMIYKRVFGLLIHNSLFLRFKKVNKNGNSYNIATNNSDTFNEQGSLNNFPGNPTLLKVGWQMNPTYTSAKDIFVICPISSTKIRWKIDLYEKIGKQISLLQPENDDRSSEIEKLLTISKNLKLKTNYGNT